MDGGGCYGMLGIRSLQKGRNSNALAFLLVAYNRKNTNHEDRLKERFVFDAKCTCVGCCVLVARGL